MTRVIAITSGKGGVGKTALTANLGVALGKLGKRVILIDTDIQMANLGLMVGLEARPITLQDILVQEAGVLDGIYDLNENVKVMPAKLSTEKMENIPEKAFSEMIGEIKEKLSPDLILLDTAPGMGMEVTSPLRSADEVIVVTMPETVSVADSMKMVMLAERRLSLDVVGTVVNMVKGLKGEMSSSEIGKTLGTDVIGSVPEDPELRRASLEGNPVMEKMPQAPSSIAIMNIAAKLTGVKPPAELKPKKRSIFDAIKDFFSKFRRKKPKLPSMKDMKMPSPPPP